MTQNKLHIEYMRLDDLMKRMHPKNPKDHDIGLITSMIREFGYKTSGMIDEGTGYFAEGHGRTEALHTMFGNGEDIPDGIETDSDGAWLVPVQRGARFETEKQLIRFYAGSNKAVMAGGWNDDLLYDALTLAFDDGSIEHIGFDDDDYQALGKLLFSDDLEFDEGNAIDSEDSPIDSESSWSPPESNVSMVQLYFDPDQLRIVSNCLKVLKEFYDAPNASIAVMNGLMTARDRAFEEDDSLRGVFDEDD